MYLPDKKMRGSPLLGFVASLNVTEFQFVTVPGDWLGLSVGLNVLGTALETHRRKLQGSTVIANNQ